MKKKFLKTLKEINGEGGAWNIIGEGADDVDAPRRPKHTYIDQVIDGTRKHFVNLKKVRQKSSSVESHFNAMLRLARFLDAVSLEFKDYDDASFVCLMEMSAGDSYYGNLAYDQALDVFLLSFPLSNLHSERIGSHMGISEEAVIIAARTLMAMMAQQLEEIMLIIARKHGDNDTTELESLPVL